MKRKTPEGTKVSFPFTNDRVFAPSGRDQNGKWTYLGTPTREFREWMEGFGPVGGAWTSEKNNARTALDIYFLIPKHALLAKLTWG